MNLVNNIDTQFKCDWEKIIRYLSSIPDLKTRDEFLESIKKIVKIPNFQDVFITRAKEISYFERKEYYTDQKIGQYEIDFIEEAPFNEYPEGDGFYYTEDQWKDLDLNMGKMIKWFRRNNKDMALTSVWLYSIGKYQSSYNWTPKERLFFLSLIIRHDILYGIDSKKVRVKIKRGGTMLCKLLSVIMHISDFTIKGYLMGFEEYMDFNNLIPMLSKSKGEKQIDSKVGKWKISREKFLELFKSLKKNNLYNEEDAVTIKKLSAITDELENISTILKDPKYASNKKKSEVNLEINFDWENLVRTLSCIPERERRDTFLLLKKEEYKDSNFQEVFRTRAREISYSERKEYYIDQNVSQQEENLIENASAYWGFTGYAKTDEYVSNKKNYSLTTSKLVKMITWFRLQNKSMALTNVWLYSLSKDFPSQTWSGNERLFILYLIIRHEILYSKDREKIQSVMGEGGKKFCTLLSIIMDVPDSTIKMQLTGFEDYMNFDKPNESLNKEQENSKSIELKEGPEKFLKFFESLYTYLKEDTRNEYNLIINDLRQRDADYKKKIEPFIKNNLN